MAEFIRMPQKGLTEESALLSTWHVKVGDFVVPGQLLFSLETGKAVFDVESEVSGTVLELNGEEGDEIAVKAVVLVVGKPGEDFSHATHIPEPVAASGNRAEQSPRSAIPVSTPFHAPASRTKRISPRARKLVDKHALSLDDMIGSGPGGRILLEDVESYLETKNVERNPMKTRAFVQEPNNIAISPMRATIAERLSKSFFTAPHVFLRISVEMDTLLGMRSKLEKETGRKISLNAYIMKLTAESLKRHPRINASWQAGSIQLFPTIDIALAVALPDGLITPVVRDCGNKGIGEIDQNLTALIEKAKKGLLTPSEYENSTFTISNLGGYGIEEFTAIINPPGSAILALGAAMKEAAVLENDTIGIQTRMRITLSCDHRLIDGAVGAAFLHDLQLSIQEPLRAML